jgi:hypothetical protein
MFCSCFSPDCGPEFFKDCEKQQAPTPLVPMFGSETGSKVPFVSPKRREAAKRALAPFRLPVYSACSFGEKHG